MPKVLTDTFSIITFAGMQNDFPGKQCGTKFNRINHVIENLILCDEIILNVDGVNRNNLSTFCSKFSDLIRLIEVPSLAKDDAEVSKNSTRALKYLNVSADLGVYYSPHPSREIYISDVVSKYTKQVASKIISYVDNKIFSAEIDGFAKVDIFLPPILEHVISFSVKNNMSISDSILEIRNSRNAKIFREYCSNLDDELSHSLPRKQIKIYKSLLNDLNSLCDKWKNDLDDGVKYKKRKISLAKIPYIGRLLEVAGIDGCIVKDPMLTKKEKYFLFLNELYS